MAATLAVQNFENGTDDAASKSTDDKSVKDNKDNNNKDNKGRLSALEAAVKQITQQYGKGAVMRLGARAAVQGADVYPTGSLGLNAALGVGGLPKGRVTEIYGPEASGKTTLALHVIAEAQRRGGTCVFVDAEHALDAAFAQRIGVNIADLWVSQPDNGEQALETVDTFVRSGSVDVVVVDSVAALVPKAEIEGDMGDAHMALQARLMSQAMRKITHNLSAANCLLIFINQIRHKVGVMFGSPEVTAGGNALKFYASVRLDIRKVSPIKEGEQVLGNRVRVKVVKNKMAPPFQQAEFDLMFGQGISRCGELVDMGVQLGVLSKSGSWFSMASDGQQLAQGRERLKRMLEEQPDLAHRVAQRIEQALSQAQAEGSAPMALPVEEAAALQADVDAEGDSADSAKPTQQR